MKTLILALTTLLLLRVGRLVAEQEATDRLAFRGDPHFGVPQFMTQAFQVVGAEKAWAFDLAYVEDPKVCDAAVKAYVAVNIWRSSLQPHDEHVAFIVSSLRECWAVCPEMPITLEGGREYRPETLLRAYTYQYDLAAEDFDRWWKGVAEKKDRESWATLTVERLLKNKSLNAQQRTALVRITRNTDVLSTDVSTDDFGAWWITVRREPREQWAGQLIERSIQRLKEGSPVASRLAVTQLAHLLPKDVLRDAGIDREVAPGGALSPMSMGSEALERWWQSNRKEYSVPPEAPLYL